MAPHDLVLFLLFTVLVVFWLFELNFETDRCWSLSAIFLDFPSADLVLTILMIIGPYDIFDSLDSLSFSLGEVMSGLADLLLLTFLAEATAVDFLVALFWALNCS